jgi:hypothetical protein
MISASASLFRNNPYAVDIVAQRYAMRKETAAIWFESIRWGPPTRPSEAVIDAVVRRMHELGRLTKRKQGHD